ncbi:MAG: leucine-rich repeat protein [Clostridia bacterium]|nr:leucine-rich repeat protein [Clostridia bacterium]
MNQMPEPKPKTRMFLISLIALTALALSLVVALLVVTVAKTPSSPAPKEEPATSTFLETDADPQPDENAEQKEAEKLVEEPPVVEEPEPKKDPQPVDLGNGLLFVKNGDGTCRLAGIGSCTDACIIIPESSPDGDLVTEISADALFGMDGVAAIQIPSTVQFIGERAFADCKDLLYISVSERNRFFCDVDGVLYSKDKSVLLQYPTLAASGSVKIPISVREIREMAFYNCPYLSKVCYAGGPADWDLIRIGAKNYSLSSAAKQFYSDRGGK